MATKNPTRRTKKIKGYPGYRIVADDELKTVEVWSNRTTIYNPEGKWWKLKQSPANTYRVVTLYSPDGKGNRVHVHHAVCRAFHGEPKWYLTKRGTKRRQEVCHGILGASCDHPDNLSWGTRQENARDMIRDGVMPQGESHARSTLTENDVREIRRLYATGEYFQHELGVMFKTPQTNIGLIVNYRAWKHVT